MISKPDYQNTKILLGNAHSFAELVKWTTKEEPEHKYFYSSGCRGSMHHCHSDSNSIYDGTPSTTPLAIGAGLAVFACIYPLAQNWSEWSQNHQITQTLVINKNLSNVELQEADDSLKTSVQDVFSKQMSLLNHLKMNVKAGLFWKAILVTSLSALVYSAGFTGLSAAITPIALTGLAISAVAMTWRSGIRSIDYTIKREIAELESAIQIATRLLDLDSSKEEISA